ncbi:hypothetical protein GCK32_022179, partial [Trichostrongylus colubriformis]
RTLSFTNSKRNIFQDDNESSICLVCPASDLLFDGTGIGGSDC